MRTIEPDQSSLYNFQTMKVSELGEFGLIKLLADTLGQGGAKHELLLGIGDDAAAWKNPKGITLATTDTMVQGVHFTAKCTWEEVGWKSMAINLSDIAAMGGIPKYALVALSLPADMQRDDVVGLYQGIGKAVKEFDVAVVGGNISRAPAVTITITLIGEAFRGRMLTRSGAMPWDVIFVTGYLGSSAAGQRMLSEDLKLDSETAAFLRAAHVRPQPRVAQGQRLATLGVRAAIDISDGLLSDIAHICEESQVGARISIDKIPIHPMVAGAFGEEALDFALAGGEDYELLFTARKNIAELVKKRLGCQVTMIGEVAAKEPGVVTLLDKDGNPVTWQQKGWDHFQINPKS